MSSPADIERTRQQLQDTVDQLSARSDPRERARQAVEPLEQNLQLVAAIAIAVLAVVSWRRRH